MRGTNETRAGDAKMTNPEIIKIKTIAAILEAIDSDDEDDAKNALKMIKAIMGGQEK
jgi:hypothetical protein